MQLNMFDMLSEVQRAAPAGPILEPDVDGQSVGPDPDCDFGPTFRRAPASAPVAANDEAIAACGRARPADNPPAFDPPVDLVVLAPGDDPVVSAPRVLADIARMLERNEDRTSIEMRSALKTLSRVLSRPLTDLPSNPSPLRVLIANAMPGLAGISNGRWSQVRSLTLRALKRCGVEVMTGRTRGGLDEAWAELNTKLVNHRLAYGLSRFLTYLSQEGATPQTVSSADFDRFQQRLLTASLLPKPEECYRTTVRLWNKAAATIDDWPQVAVDFSPDPAATACPGRPSRPPSSRTWRSIWRPRKTPTPSRRTIRVP